MKVCLLNDSFPPVLDGVVNVVMNYAQYLREDYGSPVMVGTPRYPEADYGSYPYPVVPWTSLDTADVTNGYRTGNPFDSKAVEALTAFDPEIIHSHCPASATVMARLLREETGAPIVFTYHTRYDIDLRRFLKGKTVAEEGIRAMVSNIEACDDIWVVSRGAGESLKALGFQGDYRVMNNGVDFDRGRVSPERIAEVTGGYDLPEGVPVFLFVGRMMTYKGLPMILEAMKRLREAGVDFRMVFVGKGPDQPLLEQQAREYGLLDGEGPGKCIFTGPVYDRDALRAWNCRADLFLFPSTFDTNGLVVREAAACGLASVLIEGSCAAEGITDGRNGFTIPENAEALAQLLLSLHGDLNHLHQVGQNAMDEIYLSWRDCVGIAYERYQQVLEEKAQGKLERRRRDTADYLLSMTARTMSDQAKIRRLGKALFHDFRETAMGMMENRTEAEEHTEGFWEKVAEGLKAELDAYRKE